MTIIKYNYITVKNNSSNNYNNNNGEGDKNDNENIIIWYSNTTIQ